MTHSAACSFDLSGAASCVLLEGLFSSFENVPLLKRLLIAEFTSNLSLMLIIAELLFICSQLSA